VNEQVLKRRFTTHDSRERGSLDELGSSTDDASNFQRESLNGTSITRSAKTIEAFSFEPTQREQTGFEHRSLARLFRKMMTLPHIVSKTLLLDRLIFGIVLAFLSFLSSALASSPTNTHHRSDRRITGHHIY
jgi:hypothetical protein